MIKCDKALKSRKAKVCLSYSEDKCEIRAKNRSEQENIT